MKHSQNVLQEMIKIKEIKYILYFIVGYIPCLMDSFQLIMGYCSHNIYTKVSTSDKNTD